MGSIIIVQQIVTHWTRTSRGGKNAVLRNAIPQTAPIPAQHLQATGLNVLHHNLFYSEQQGFTQPREEFYRNPVARPLILGCVRVDWEEDKVLVSFRYALECGGLPKRAWAQEDFQISEGEWGQMRVNGRFKEFTDFSETGEWYYQRTIVNIGLFERPNSGVFTQCEPNYRYAAIGRLF